MATYNSELETELRWYIDSFLEDGKYRLRKLLKNESVGTRYELLMNVRGIFGRMTCLHRGAYASDLETIKYVHVR